MIGILFQFPYQFIGTCDAKKEDLSCQQIETHFIDNVHSNFNNFAVIKTANCKCFKTVNTRIYRLNTPCFAKHLQT